MNKIIEERSLNIEKITYGDDFEVTQNIKTRSDEYLKFLWELVRKRFVTKVLSHKAEVIPIRPISSTQEWVKNTTDDLLKKAS